MQVLLSLLAAVLLGGCTSKPELAAAPRGPRPKFVSEAVDLGLFDSEGERNVVYEVRNEGDEVLRIERVDSTCGCAKPRFPKVLKPGERGEIVVGFAPEPVDAGLKVESVTVFTNARPAPYALQFQADLQPLLRLAPGTPLVVPIEPGGIASQMVALTPRRGTGIEVTAFESNDPRVTVEKVETGDGSFAVKLTVRSKGPGDFIAPLTIKATHPRLASLLYQVGAQAVRGPVSRPPVLKVPALSADAAGTAFPEVVVFARDRPLRVKSAKVLDPALEVTAVDPGERGTSVRLTYRGGWKRRGTRTTELVVETDHPAHPVLRVPIEVKVI